MDLIGDTPEVIVDIEGIRCKALVDTGSQVTTMAHSCFLSHFSGIPLEDCRQLVRIEGVGGEVVPYHGFFHCEVSLALAGSTPFARVIPVLVVPNTTFNTRVPILIGTNFLEKLIADSSVQTSALGASLRVAVLALR